MVNTNAPKCPLPWNGAKLPHWLSRERTVSGTDTRVKMVENSEQIQPNIARTLWKAYTMVMLAVGKNHFL